MKLDRLTIKAEEALSAASAQAGEHSHQMISTEHLLFALIQQKDGVVLEILEKIGVSSNLLLKKIEKIFEKNPQVSLGNAQIQGQIFISPELQTILTLAEKTAKDLKDEFISTEHLLLGIAEESKSKASQLLLETGITKETILKSLQLIRGSQRITSPSPEETYKPLEKYGRDLTEMAKLGKLDPVIGRDNEIRRTIQVISRRTKNNPVLIGEPGVGKTAIVEGLAQRIVAGNVPESLFGKRVVELDLAAILSGTRFRGDMEERLKTIIDEIKDNRDNLVVFIDEIHLLVGIGSGG